jgi:epoxyqueuosine reductase QueG
MVPLPDLVEIARTDGAPLCGAAKTEDLSGNTEEIGKILPGVRSVVVLAAPHSRSALESRDVQAAQYDTIHVTGEAARASHAVARWLEKKGHRAVAVPAFIPIDMSPPKHGMKGAVEGNYYYCFACQAACPVGRVSRA